MIYTFDGIKTEIQNRLSLLSNWNTTLYFGVYERLTDVMAYTANKLVYLAEFLYRESRWTQAQQRSSMVALAKLLNYEPRRKSGAIGELLLSANSAFNTSYVYNGKEVLIARWTRFTDANASLNVYCSEDTHYYTGTIGNLTIPVVEGQPKEYLYIASGIADEVIKIYSDSIDNYELEILIVDSTNVELATVTIVDKLYYINDTTTYNCEVETSPDNDYISITFGDGINARKLSSGERVLVKYAETLGYEGNISSASLITVIKDTLVDEDNNVATLYVTNTEGILGGAEAEDIESIRNTANNLFQIGMLLSSAQNWRSIIESASYVNKSVVWSIEDLGGTITGTDQNIVYITAVSNTGEDLTTAQKDDLLDNYITPKKSLTEIVQFENIQKIYTRFKINAKIKNQTIYAIDSDIKSALEADYGVLNTEFQQNIYESNFYATINNVTDVVYHESDIYYLEAYKNYFVTNQELLTSYTSSDTTDLDKQNYLVADSLSLWIRRKIAGSWSGSLQIAATMGSYFSGMNGYTISSGYVDYTNNIYSYTVNEIAADLSQTIYGVPDPDDTEDLGYILYLSYKMQDGNTPAGQTNSIRLPYFYQITDTLDSFIDTDLSYI